MIENKGGIVALCQVVIFWTINTQLFEFLGPVDSVSVSAFYKIRHSEMVDGHYICKIIKIK